MVFLCNCHGLLVYGTSMVLQTSCYFLFNCLSCIITFHYCNWIYIDVHQSFIAPDDSVCGVPA